MNKPIQCRSDMRLQCMGHVRLIDSAGHDHTPRTRKARALLAFLALAGRPVSRDRLADLLWSDRGEDQARSSLRQALHELRHIGSPGPALVTATRSEVQLNHGRIETEFDAIRDAAAAGNAELLLSLLERTDHGLLADLDGLDPIFDEWLRAERGAEPEGTLAVAIDGARKIFAADGPAIAAPIIAEIQRIDPACEEAARLRMEADHRLGDRSALHRHFAQFREQLHKDFDAKPAPETIELFARLSDPERPAAPTRLPVHPTDLNQAQLPTPARRPKAMPAFAAMGLLVVVLLGLAGLGWRTTAPPAASNDLPLVAVLPFEQQNATPAPLAAGLWDDTRLALSQNRSVRVLGRTTSLSLAKGDRSPQLLHRRLGVDYLLEGGVRSQGDRARIVVSLTRARDGVSVWEKSFEGRLGDPLALQLAVAHGIEGRLRARLAPGGGVRASHITTSPEVYALYTEARADIRVRGQRSIAAGAEKLRRAVALDPNYAPALASLASTVAINRQNPEGLARDRAEAAAQARRAIELAPNLAEAHAALALIQGERLPSSERLLKRAVALDPGNAEAWNWLGNSYAKRALNAQAVAAYDRAVAIDPFYFAPAANLLDLQLQGGQLRAAEALIAGIARTSPDPADMAALRARLLVYQGDHSAAAAPLLKLRGLPADWPGSGRGELGSVLLRLGYADQTGRLWSQSASFGPLIRGEIFPPDQIEGAPIGPRDFWLAPYFGTVASRAMLIRNRPDLLVRQYRDGFRSRDDFIRTLDAAGTLESVVPALAVALRRTGNRAEANAILDPTAATVRQRLLLEPGDRELRWELARIRAQQGAIGNALALLTQAHRAGWMPDGHLYPIDIAADPAMAPLKGKRRFEAIRRQILLHIARERRELGPVKL